jgi:hypothetical protein
MLKCVQGVNIQQKYRPWNIPVEPLWRKYEFDRDRHRKWNISSWRNSGGRWNGRKSTAALRGGQLGATPMLLMTEALSERSPAEP